MTGKFARFCILLTIFLSSYILFRSPFEGYITYLVMVMFFPIYVVRYGIPRLPVLLFTPILISGLIYIQVGDNETGLFIKIFIGFFSSVLFYRYVLQAFEYDVDTLFEMYLKGSVVVSMIGLFQMLSFFVGFGPGFDYSWILNKWGTSPGGLGIRLNSIFSEPAYFAGVVGPAFFVSIYNLFFRKNFFIKNWQCIVIITAYMLTFSTLGIISIFVSAFLLLLNFGFVKYAVIVVPLGFFGYQYAYNNIEDFRERVDGTTKVFSSDEMPDINEVHGSSFVLYNNYVIATENFSRNTLFGTGLGSHPVAFDRYSLTNAPGMIQINFNKADANSMLLRLLSETGLYGVSVMIWLVLSNLVPKNRSQNETNWLMSNAILVVILVYLMRQGHYFINGFPFFLWMYYYIRKKNVAMANAETEEEAQAIDKGSSPNEQLAPIPQAS
ncbi:hypothetical protein [Sanyastnella coralliicola]|uniref:hypothetical protein n=1 Tax=Sanyastnella coralliicola TaxID=3069118 RepID=UPI0027B9A930|nr:hypothetical protein [Longitalea sp. SCSIO 12813]